LGVQGGEAGAKTRNFRSKRDERRAKKREKLRLENGKKQTDPPPWKKKTKAKSAAQTGTEVCTKKIGEGKNQNR